MDCLEIGSYSGLYPPRELSCNSTATAQEGLIELTGGHGRGVGGCASVRIRLDRVFESREGKLIVTDCRGTERSEVGVLW